MQVHLRRSDKSVDDIVRAAFPEYRGQNIVATVSESIVLYGTMWDEGNKREYVFLRLSDMQRVDIPEEHFGKRSELHNRDIPIPEGVVVVVHCMYGQRERIEIHCNAANITPMLPAPIELSEDERIVLKATRSLKSSYAGIKNYRFVEASGRTGITQERWDVAKASLIEKKFLNRAGAITTEGRNAIGDDRF